MRDELSKYEGRSITLIGKFIRYGKQKRKDSNKNTLLLSNLRFDDGSFASSHLWFTAKHAFMYKEIKVGATVEVFGKVRKYTRTDGSIDYSVENCTNVKILKQGNRLMPSRVWENDYEMVFKFIFDNGPSWYRVVKATKRVDKLFIRFYDSDILEKNYTELVGSQKDYILKTINPYLVLGAKIKFIHYE